MSRTVGVRDVPAIPLMVTPRPGLRISERGFSRLCAANPELRLERSAQGELIVMPPAGSETGGRNAGLTAQLWLWNDRSEHGMVFDSSAGFRLPNGASRSPDAAWVARDRWEALPPEDRRGFAPICPDFVVELMSPSDQGHRSEVRLKMGEYWEQGVRLGWLLDPEAREIEIYRPGQVVETLANPGTLLGEDVLSGFVLELRGIFPEVRP